MVILLLLHNLYNRRTTMSMESTSFHHKICHSKLFKAVSVFNKNIVYHTFIQHNCFQTYRTLSITCSLPRLFLRPQWKWRLSKWYLFGNKPPNIWAVLSQIGTLYGFNSTGKRNKYLIYLLNMLSSNELYYTKTTVAFINHVNIQTDQ